MTAMDPRHLLDLALAQVMVQPQVRQLFNEADIAELAQSIREIGLQQPLLVEPAGDAYKLVDGARRLLAVTLLGWATVPAIVTTAAQTKAETIQRQLILNCQRADLTPLEAALGIKQLLRETGWPASEAAKRLGSSPAMVSKLLSVLVLPAALQDAVHRGRVAASTAYEIAKERDPKARARLAEAALAGTLTRDEAAQRTRRRESKRRTRGRVTAARRPRAELDLGRGRSVRIAGEGLTPSTLVEWIEELLLRARPLAAESPDLPSLAAAIREKGVA